jgi:acyl-coenzyme A synthetase/AMP-(fatty) acid ligase
METLLGDAIEMTAPDRFRLLGRMGDLVNIAGKRSSLAYLNVQLSAIPGVEDGVFVMPPEETTEEVTRLMAFVVAPSLTVEIILAALRQRIDPAFMPRPLCLVPALPRNSVGKLPAEQLRQLLAVAADGH